MINIKVFYKNKDTLIYGYPEEVMDKISFDKTLIYNIGIDASTTCFGLSWYTSPNENVNMMMCMRSDKDTVKNILTDIFDFLRRLFIDTKFLVATYERTPDDFVNDSMMVRTMKATEKSVKRFLNDSYFINIDNKDYIFGIFPNSWRALTVERDIDNNAGKKDKRINSQQVLKYCGLSDDWLKELDECSFNHMYDCFEALGIGVYGSEFIYGEPLIRTYRNFTRRKPLYVIAKLTIEEELFKDTLLLQNILNNVKVVLFTPNDYHSSFENINALDCNEYISLMLVDNSSINKTYFEHITNIYSEVEDSILLLTTMRVNDVNKKLLKQLVADNFNVTCI